jgi:hypothetical protein
MVRLLERQGQSTDQTWRRLLYLSLELRLRHDVILRGETLSLNKVHLAFATSTDKLLKEA